MKITVTNRLTLGYLSKLSRYNYIATASAAFIVIVSLYWMLFHIGRASGTTLFANAVYTLAAAIAAIWALQIAYLARYGAIQLAPRHQLAWLLIGLALLANTLKGVYYGYQEYTLGHNPFPSYSDILSNLFYPLVFAGLIFMPARTRFRPRMVFDAIITTLCFLGVSWFFVIGPAYFAKAGTLSSFSELLKLITALSYPCWGILLIVALTLLIERGTVPVLRLSLLLICVSIIANLWASTAHAYMCFFTETYQTGTPYVDTFWLISFLLMGLAALYQYSTLVRRTYSEQLQSQQLTPQAHAVLTQNGMSKRGWWRVQSMLIYVPLIIMLCLAAFGEIFRDNKVADYLLVLTAFTSVLVGIRHFCTTRENEEMLREREQRYQDAEHLQRIVAQLTPVLDLELLRALVVDTAILELGFSAAMLLLVEEHDQPQSTVPHLLVNAASTTALPLHWRLQGDNILYHILSRQTEIHWVEHIEDTPAEVQIWQQEQHIPTMLFIPLIYQDRVLGSLGVARRTAQGLSPRDETIAQAYAEQVAAIIEHALLCQEAREHETFAHAMANIAARLNAAVVAPAEISQLICQEGANALQADLAVLYITGENGRLIPLAAANEQESTSLPHDWPLFHISEYAMLAQDSLDPVLYEVTRKWSAPPTPNPLPLGASSSRLPVVRTLYRQRAFSLQFKLVQHSVHTAILAPLVAGGHLVGILLLARTLLPGQSDKRSFDASDLPQAQDFAQQAGVAFNNAQLYQHIHTAHKRLQELDQLKDQFMITASHELRTPLTAVQGYIELMAQFDDVLPTEQRQEFLQKARRGCDELVLLLCNIMDANRLEMEANTIATLIQPVSLQEMIESVLVLIGPQLTQEKREVQVHVPSRLFVYADPIRFRQVLMNISVNALKYSPAGTSISFSARIGIDQGSSALISISDKGKGVPLEQQAHLFERFFRLESDINSPVRGSGLGLYIARRLIEAMNGKIWIESRGIAGEGSTFHVQLPLAY